MDIHLNELENSIILIHIKGRFDLDLANEFENIIDNIIKKYPDSDILVNLTDVASIGSSGFRVLVVAERKLKEREKSVVVYGANELCSKLMNILRFEVLVRVFTTKDDAIRYLKNE